MVSGFCYFQIKITFPISVSGISRGGIEPAPVEYFWPAQVYLKRIASAFLINVLPFRRTAGPIFTVLNGL